MRITLLQNITRIYSGGSPKLQFTIFDGRAARYAGKPLLRNRMESRLCQRRAFRRWSMRTIEWTFFICDNKKLSLRLFWQQNELLLLG